MHTRPCTLCISCIKELRIEMQHHHSFFIDLTELKNVAPLGNLAKENCLALNSNECLKNIDQSDGCHISNLQLNLATVEIAVWSFPSVESRTNTHGYK